MPVAHAPESWEDREAFPAHGRPSEKLKHLLGYAVLAPSTHNTQPWLFKLREDTLELRSDRSRLLDCVDPDGRELVISCGAALENLLIAIRYHGYEEVLEPLHEVSDPDLLARVTLGERRSPLSEEIALFDAIPLRRTNRSQFDTTPVPDALVTRMREAAAGDGLWTSTYSHPEGKYALADLITEGDRVQLSDERFLIELASWSAGARGDRRDGVPGHDRELTAAACGRGLVLRTFDAGGLRPAREHDLAAGSPVLFVIGTDDDDRLSWLATGRALERMLLLARSAGVSASFLNQPVEVPEVRSKLRDLVGLGGYPQALVRIGYGPGVAATPRRPLDDVLV
jgi:hypothetical protein